MTEFKYRVYFENEPIRPELMQNLEEIIVEQEMDMAWEARLVFNIILEDSGYWSTETNELLRIYSRIRIEIQSSNSSYIPIIDGPIVNYEYFLNSEPGGSTVTVIVHDDSVFLNLNDEVVKYDDMLDHEVVQDIFNRFSQISDTDIENTPRPPEPLPPVVVQHGTAMQFLRFLAKRNGFLVYVLPGENPGQSTGCFRSPPIELEDLSPLILLGPNRNINSIHIKNNGQKLANITTSSLILSSKEVISTVSNVEDVELMGEIQSIETSHDIPTLFLPFQYGSTVDLDHATLGKAREASFTIQATGSILTDHYPDILQPYQVITVLGVSQQMSGNFLIQKVTHTIKPTEYSQSFSLIRNARFESEVEEGQGVF
jgi:hypothetical protein